MRYSRVRATKDRLPIWMSDDAQCPLLCNQRTRKRTRPRSAPEASRPFRLVRSLAIVRLMSAQPCSRFQKSSVFSFLSHVRQKDCAECQTAIGSIRAQSRVKRWVKGLLLFLVGAVASPAVLYGIATYWPFWPASHAYVDTFPLQGVGRNARGCLAYHITMLSDRGIDDAYLKFRFPMRVSDVKAGRARSDALPSENVNAEGMEEFAKDETGACRVRTLNGVIENDVTTNISEHSVEIRLGRIPTRMATVIAVVGSDEKSPGEPESPPQHSGFFGWTMLGYSAHRPVAFADHMLAFM